MLKVRVLHGSICLKYLDESGCCCQRLPNYGYGQRGQQKKVVQHKRRGRRINIWGVWEPQKRFDYALMVGSLKAETFVRLIDWQASIAQKRFDLTGQLTVMVQGNASVHKSQLVQGRLEQ